MPAKQSKTTEPLVAIVGDDSDNEGKYVMGPRTPRGALAAHESAAWPLRRRSARLISAAGSSDPQRRRCLLLTFLFPAFSALR